MRQITERIVPGHNRIFDLPWNRRCLLFNMEEGEYWRVLDGSIRTTDVEEAIVFNMRDVRNMRLDRDFIQIQIFEDTPLNGKKCLLEQVLPKTVIELLRMAPANEIARAHALAQLTVAIPNDCQTFERIKEFVENNIDPTTVRPIIVEVPQERPATPTRMTIEQLQAATGNQVRAQQAATWIDLPDPTPTPLPTPAAFSIQVNRSEIERGRCHYSVPRSGETMFRVTADYIGDAVDAAIDSGEGLREAAERLEEFIYDDVNVETEPHDDDYDYHDHESNDTTDVSESLNIDRLRELLENYLRNNDPEALQTLEENAQ